MSQIVFHVQDAHGAPLSGVHLDAKNQPFGNWSGDTDAAGNFVAGLGPGHYDITYTKAGYKTVRQGADLEFPGTVTVAMDAGSDPVFVTVQGINFVRSDGSLFLYKGVTEFDAYWKHLDGTLDDGVLAQRQRCGRNVSRVFLNWGVANFDPVNYGDRFFAELTPFNQRMAKYGSLVEYVLFAPKPLCQSLQSRDAQVNFALRVYQGLGAEMYFVEMGNEVLLTNEVYLNDIPAPPAPIPWASGAYQLGSEDPHSHRLGTYYTFHGRRNGAWQAIIDCAPVEFRRGVLGMPCLNDEPARCPDDLSEVAVFGEMGGLGLSENGVTFHSARGRSSDYWDQTEEACARAMFAR